MKYIKKLVALTSVQIALAWIFAVYIRFVYRTSHFTFLHKKRLDVLIERNATVIIAFWHGRLAMMPCGWVWEPPVYMLLSQHRDGMLISRILRYFGIQSIWGSSTRGGVGAGLQVLDKIKRGAVVGITPDGPRGPNQVCSMGVMTLAKLACETAGDVFIVPVSYSIARHKHLGSWDRLMIPLPFSRGVFVIGKPVHVHSMPDEPTLLEKRTLLEQRLNEIQDVADRCVRGKKVN